MNYTSSDFRPWEMPEHSGFNRLPMHGLSFPFDSAALARADAAAGPLGRDLSKNRNYQSLDGTWDFQYFDSPEAVPEQALAGSPDSKGAFSPGAGWKPIAVPGTWTVQGWDKPHYTNVIMPFDAVPPATPEINPTGVYRRTFSLDPSWAGRRIVFRAGSAESYLEVYVNGIMAGSSKDTRLPCEFDVTGLVREGCNSLALLVVRYSDASYIEDQDQWWYGGLHRSVCLYSTSNVFLADADIRPVLSADFSSGEIVSRITAGFGSLASGTGAASVRVAVYAPDGTVAGEAEAAIDPVYQRSRREVSVSIPVAKPLAWNHETPNLYTVVLSLIDGNGQAVDHRSCRVGFRTISISKRALLVNGKRVLIKGVNRHEHDECMAKTLSTEGMLEDILLMKRHNFNAVRASHYPNDERWYELCDQFGLYLWDEANIENHAYYDHVSRNSRWAAAYLERLQRMVLRDKNHPSVIVWSLGNESGYGENHDMLAGWLRRFDPSRPLHYEGGIRPEWGQGWHTMDSMRRGKNVTDIIGPMYPPVDLIRQWDREVDSSEDERPLIMCEYSHAMGNSNGSLSDYWEAIEESRSLQGGFIWDWIDQGILVDGEGKPVGPRGKKAAASGPAGASRELSSPAWRYGGDFGDQPCDYDFCLNGLVFPDRSVKPVMAECLKLFQPFRVASAHPSSGRFTFVNRLDFSDSSLFSLSWRLVSDGSASGISGTVTLPLLAPGEKADFDVPELRTAAVRSLLFAGECLVHFEIRLSRDMPWGEKGHLAGWEEFALSAAPAFTPALPVLPAADCTLRPDGALRFEGASYSATISGEGFLCSFSDRKTGREFLVGPLAMNVYRAPTQNDGLKNFEHVRGNPLFTFYFEQKALYPWLDNRLDALRFAPADGGIDLRSASEGRVRVAHRVTTASGAAVGRFEQDWLFTGRAATGTFFFALEDTVPEYPRIGLSARIGSAWDGVSWFGRGPGENYPDRKAGSAVGRYRSSVDSLYVPYTVPQENGSRSDVRRIDFFPQAEKTGRGIRIDSAETCSFGVSRFDPSAMWKAKHADELTPIDGAELFLDAAIRGLGTATCGPDTLERYRVRPGVYSMTLSFSIDE